MGRRLAGISLLIVLLVSLSVYGPWDFLGAYAKQDAACVNLSDGMHIYATGEIEGKEIKNDKTIYYVKNGTITCDNGILKSNSFIFKLDSDNIPNKSKINIEGNVLLFSCSRNEGGFDTKSYYSSLGYYFEIKEPKVSNAMCNPILTSDRFYKLSKRMLEVYSLCLPGEEAGFLASVTIGNKSELDSDLKSLFQLVGLAHILAVSGLHVSVVCMSIYKFIRRFGISFIAAGITAGSVAILYGLLTGGSLSCIRAIGMFLIFLMADITGESYDSLTALSLMAILLLFENPLYIKNSSFIFSFGAIIGILFIAQPLSHQYLKICNKKKRLHKSENGVFVEEKKPIYIKISEWLLLSIIFSFGINIAMLPIVTGYYYETPIYSGLLNLLILPFLPFLLGFGLIGGFAGICFLQAAKIILFPCHVLIYYIESISSFFSKLPFSTVIVGKRKLIWCLIYYLIIFLVINVKKEKVLFDEMNPQKQLAILKKNLMVKLFLLIVAFGIWLMPTKPGFEIDILDVGQGDGIYISCEDGQRFFIDGGSTSTDLIGKYTLLPFLKYKGAGHIDYWFISHMDLDHVSGLLELLEGGYRIDNIVVSSEILKDDDFLELLKLADKNKTKILYMKQGDSIKSRHISFKCIYPGIGMTSDDINSLSLALLLEYDKDLDQKCDFSGFFGGDLGSQQERLIAESNMVTKVNLLKVSHHGSKFSSDESFLSALSPKISVVSCGKINRYGHPAKEAVERLEEYSDELYYTMNSGQVKVDMNGVDLFIW